MTVVGAIATVLEVVTLQGTIYTLAVVTPKLSIVTGVSLETRKRHNVHLYTMNIVQIHYLCQHLNTSLGYLQVILCNSILNV